MTIAVPGERATAYGVSPHQGWAGGGGIAGRLVSGHDGVMVAGLKKRHLYVLLALSVAAILASALLAKLPAYRRSRALIERHGRINIHMPSAKVLEILGPPQEIEVVTGPPYASEGWAWREGPARVSVFLATDAPPDLSVYGMMVQEKDPFWLWRACAWADRVSSWLGR